MTELTLQAASLLEDAIGKCCGAPVRAPLDRAEAVELAGLLKAVADPARLQLISILRTEVDCTACVNDLVPLVGLSQPTVSHHLKVLTDAGILARERRGTQARFTLVPERLAQIGQIFA
ncbi:ArsR family transcriptional regulator [Intrasporangium oryzae NRRL B-24470]|uniref:ArsR family transcriptional regulator n=1 Tax=Intrasporangium oryzae NRRL B-24470 TaxID=1386089 RepID=W9G948_9MICO|nr:metalloregulator ArsR/SmtB family transcription factor [Intrasporangium oryzae]EWT02545.1 ArsR family transcriptional regulator [Intrasporangium oryzae NRRL B-24470]